METIQLPDFTKKRTIPVSSIEYIEGLGNYTIVHLSGQKPLLVAVTLKRLTERLPTFLRIHKSTLVNPAYIVGYQSRQVGTSFIRLSKDRVLPISRRRVAELRPQLVSFPQCVR